MRRKGWVAELALASLCTLVGAACGGEPSATNLVVVCIDGLRADEAGCYGSSAGSTPALDSLAREGLRYEAAYACAPWSVPSVASVWTGVPPEAHGVESSDALLAADAATLAEVLAQRGYETVGVSGDYRTGRARGLDQGFASFRALDIEAPGEPTSERVVERAAAHLAVLADSPRPFFLYVHLSDPLPPLERHLEDGEALPGSGEIVGGEPLEYLQVAAENLAPPELQRVRALYSGEVREADRALARLLAELERLDLRDDTVVAVFSAHGYEWGDRGWIGDAHSLHEELVRVPLVIAGPRVAEPGSSRREPVSLCGLASTLLEHAQLDTDALPQAGRSFFAPGGAGVVAFSVDFEPRFAGVRARTARLRGIRSGRWKLIENRAVGTLELYDLVRDPLELSDLSRQQPVQRESMLRELRAAFRATP